MSEMLGNQYFMTRKYQSALNQFEDTIEEHPENMNVRKKLIICYTQTKQLEKAIKLFTETLHENPDSIIDTDLLKDDCPCPDLISTIENKLKNNLENYSYSTFQALGILWLYCNLKKSIENFERAVNLKPENKEMNTILTILKRKLADSKNSLKVLGSSPA